MKKSKFILSILALTVYQTQASVTYEYINYNNSTGLFDVNVNIDNAANSARIVTLGAVGGISSWDSAPYNDYSILNSDISERKLDVHNTVVNVTNGNAVYITAGSNGEGTISGTKTLNISGGSIDYAVGGLLMVSNYKPASGKWFEQAGGVPVKNKNLITINMTGGTVYRLCGASTFEGTTTYVTEKGLSAFAHGGDILMNITGGLITGRVSGGGGGYGCVDGKVTIIFGGDAIFKGSSSDAIYGGARDEGSYVGSTEVVITGNAQIYGDVYGGGSDETTYINGDTKVVVSGNAQILKKGNGSNAGGNVYGGGVQDVTKGNSLVVLESGTVEGSVYASGPNNTIEGTATVQILSGDWSQTKIYGKTEGATVKGGTELIVGAEGIAYSGELGSIAGFDRVTVAKGSKLNLQSGNVFDVPVHNYTITANNLGTEGEAITIVTPDADLYVDKPITLNFSTEGRVISGRYKVIDATQGKQVDTSTNWDSEHVTVTGQGVSFDGLVWDGNVLYVDYVSPVVGNVVSGNWGVFKSSQAFTGTLWGNRANACVLSTPAQQSCIDAKGNCIPAAAPTGTTLAWGTVYGQSARISGAGADYSVYGGAVGVEHQFVSGRSIGAALGYDWGEVSPFGYSEIDQESFHAAVYGRAGIWQLGANSAVAVDLSAAYGSTESDTAMVSGDWQQDSLQLDARVSYLRQLGASTTGSVFAGVQYYAADSDTVDGMEISSMQNLRTEIGAGVSHKATENTTVYGEISVYNDAMRHNPYVADGGNRYYGTNPGRLGGSISVGAQYDLNDNWSVRGSYSFDAADDSTEHNLNAGAVYKF